MKTTKLLLLLLLSGTMLFSSCKKTDDSTKEKELELKERELALKERELDLQNNGNGGNTTATTSTPKKGNDVVSTENLTIPPSNSGKSVTGTITGEGVILRQLNSTESAKMGSFSKGEKVTILEQTKPQNQNQAIAAKPIKLANEYNGKYLFTLNKGKALLIEEFTGTSYNVSYQHPQMGKLYATVMPSDLESISNEVWYKVKSASGQEGWVLGKFVQK